MGLSSISLLSQDEDLDNTNPWLGLVFIYWGLTQCGISRHKIPAIINTMVRIVKGGLDIWSDIHGRGSAAKGALDI
jgi:hypothetical protein